MDVVRILLYLAVSNFVPGLVGNSIYNVPATFNWSHKAATHIQNKWKRICYLMFLRFVEMFDIIYIYPEHILTDTLRETND